MEYILYHIVLADVVSAREELEEPALAPRRVSCSSAGASCERDWGIMSFATEDYVNNCANSSVEYC